MNIKNKIIISIFCLMVIFTSFCSCSKKQEETEITPKKQETQEVKQTTKNPLTGLAIEDKFKDNRPIGVMINNISLAQPLLGVCDADIMYECLVEGGITRILAIYQYPGGVSKIGSIRSARPCFINIDTGHDAIYCHIGASTEATKMLSSSSSIDSFDLGGHSDMMWRDQTRMNTLGYEHSALTSGKMLINGIKKSGTRTKIKNSIKTQAFSENSPVLNGETANSITAEFSNYKTTTFSYDEKSKEYLIYQFGKEQIDANAGKQNSKSNIVILGVNSWVSDEEGHVALDLLNNSGNGKYFYGGKYINIKWSKKSASDPIEYRTSSGELLEMMPGKIYVCMIPLNADISIE